MWISKTDVHADAGWAAGVHVSSGKMEEGLMKASVATPTVVHSSCMLIVIDASVAKTGFIYYFKD